MPGLLCEDRPTFFSSVFFFTFGFFTVFFFSSFFFFFSVTVVRFELFSPSSVRTSVCVCVFVRINVEGLALVALSAVPSPQREEAGESSSVQEIGQHASLCCCPWAGE